jgi:hypothetical protein
MTLSTVAPGYSCGISYSYNTWCCWTQPTGAPERYLAHVAHTSDMAIERAVAASSPTVGTKLRRLASELSPDAKPLPEPDAMPRHMGPPKSRSLAAFGDERRTGRAEKGRFTASTAVLTRTKSSANVGTNR